jgi:hypothetical protein
MPSFSITPGKKRRSNEEEEEEEEEEVESQGMGPNDVVAEEAKEKENEEPRGANGGSEGKAPESVLMNRRFVTGKRPPARSGHSGYDGKESAPRSRSKVSNLTCSDKENLKTTFQGYSNGLEESFQKMLSGDLKSKQIMPLLDQYLDAVNCLNFEYCNRRSDIMCGFGRFPEVAVVPSKPRKRTREDSSAGNGAKTNPGSSLPADGKDPASSSSSNQPSESKSPASSEKMGASSTATSHDCDTSASVADGNTEASSLSKLDTVDMGWKELADLGNVIGYNHRGGETKKFCKGTLKVQEHTFKKSRRMLVRNAMTGRVELNISIYSGMKTEKKVNDTNGCEYAIFKSINAANTSAEGENELFTLRRRGGQSPSMKDVFDTAAIS